MFKIRSGVFETNSSSTHTCVLTSSSTYEKWCKKELAFALESYEDNYMKALVKKYSKPEYIVDEDFIDVKAFEDITLENVYESKDSLLKNFDPKSKGVTLKEFWDIYITFNVDRCSYDEDAFIKAYENILSVNPRIKLLQELLNTLDGYHDPDEINYDAWNHLFKYILSVYTSQTLCEPYGEKEDITRKTIDGKDIIAFCTYGHD